MRSKVRLLLAAVLLSGSSAAVSAQAPTPANTNAQASVAATVNGQVIPESAVKRALDRIPPIEHEKARPEIINFLIDIALLDQYLKNAKIEPDAKEVDKQIEQLKKEAQQQGTTFEEMLKKLRLTEAELREHIVADQRWEKFLSTQATDAVLKPYFEANKEVFNGTLVRAKHLLLTPASGDAKAHEATKAQLVEIKRQIEAAVAAGLAKLPANADALTREKERARLVDEEFGKLAKEKSQCGSRAQNGDVGWFERSGTMVEPFSRAAFAQKPGQISDPVQTQFGFHLILTLERKDGKDVKFEDMKNEVREFYGDKLKESILSQLRQQAKIVITPAAK